MLALIRLWPHAGHQGCPRRGRRRQDAQHLLLPPLFHSQHKQAVVLLGNRDAVLPHRWPCGVPQRQRGFPLWDARGAHKRQHLCMSPRMLFAFSHFRSGLQTCCLRSSPPPSAGGLRQEHPFKVVRRCEGTAQAAAVVLLSWQATSDPGYEAYAKFATKTVPLLSPGSKRNPLRLPKLRRGTNVLAFEVHLHNGRDFSWYFDATTALLYRCVPLHLAASHPTVQVGPAPFPANAGHMGPVWPVSPHPGREKARLSMAAVAQHAERAVLTLIRCSVVPPGPAARIQTSQAFGLLACDRT